MGLRSTKLIATHSMTLSLRLASAILAATVVAACGAQPTPIVPTATPAVPPGAGALLSTALAPTATPRDVPAPTTAATPSRTPVPTAATPPLRPTAAQRLIELETSFQRVEGAYAFWEVLTDTNYQSLLTLAAFAAPRPDSPVLFLRCFEDTQETEVEILWLGIPATADYHDEVAYSFGELTSNPDSSRTITINLEEWDFQAYQPEIGAAVLATFSDTPGAFIEQLLHWDWLRVALLDSDQELLDGAEFDLRGLPDARKEARWGCG